VGSFRKENPRTPALEWIIRGVIVLGCYATQIYVVAHGWGRAAAGYYAPTLPAAGAYLWRYLWLVRHRTRLVYLAITLSALTSKANRLRQKFLEKLDETLPEYEETASAPH
jgi:hypothetical protein